LAIRTSGKWHPNTSKVSLEERGNPEGGDISSLPVDYEKRKTGKSRRSERLGGQMVRGKG
jgi:hypothetical protein